MAGKYKKSIADLIAAAHADGRRVTLPAPIAAKIKADLLLVLAAEKAGRATPTNKDLAEFFTDKYGVHSSRYIVARWKTAVRKGIRLT